MPLLMSKQHPPLTAMSGADSLVGSLTDPTRCEVAGGESTNTDRYNLRRILIQHKLGLNNQGATHENGSIAQNTFQSSEYFTVNLTTKHFFQIQEKSKLHCVLHSKYSSNQAVNEHLEAWECAKALVLQKTYCTCKLSCASVTDLRYCHKNNAFQGSLPTFTVQMDVKKVF